MLAGVRSVTLHDAQPTRREDFSTQFYLRDSDLGESRAKASLQRVAELNHYVHVTVHEGALDEAFLSKFRVVVATDLPLERQVAMGDYLHSKGIAFIVADTRGVFGQLFCDFGDDFEVLDTNGEPPSSVMIASITCDEEGIVTCLDESRHNFETGDYVRFTEVQGMTDLNDTAPIPIRVLGPFTFSIGDTRRFGNYTRGGIATQAKMPKRLSFVRAVAAYANRWRSCARASALLRAAAAAAARALLGTPDR